jgi:ATP-dependent DNA helicase RecQ
MIAPEIILKQTFGFDSFKALQREVIRHVLDKRDTLAVMPTGGGKSLCYQIPALTFQGLTVVVSPLIALMKDQVEQMHALGIPALFLNSSLSPEEYRAGMQSVRAGEARLLLVAPETLLLPHILDLLSERQVDCLTIDEAHCISEWGHDFRPEYRKIAAVRKLFPKAVCLALTATATLRVRADITSSLGFPENNTLVASFNRQNLYIEVTPKHDPAEQIEQFLKRFENQSGIIYCFSRKQVDELAEWLTRHGHSARPYHAGLKDDERRRNQEAFIRDDVQIMVATIAFGMGINKPNVRFVIHHDLPKSIEGYYQEIGRAGRDGLPAHCLLLYSYADVVKLRYFIDQKEGDERKVAQQHMKAMVRYAEDDTQCRRRPLLGYFGETYTSASCENCDICNDEPPALQDITLPAQKFLSCVARTGGRFGIGHMADILTGSDTEKIRKFGHDKLPTFGIGKDLSAYQWTHLARHLIATGRLVQEDEFHTVRLTPQSVVALRARSNIMGVLRPPEERPRRKARKVVVEGDEALFELLRKKRKHLADAAGVPPYVVFSDRTLVEMAARFPQSEQSLGRVSGVGQAKLRNYGADFLEVICAYCQGRGIAEDFDETAEPPVQAKKKGISMRAQLVGDAYNAGAKIQDLMFQYDVQMGTILNHLENYRAAGHAIRPAVELETEIKLSPGQQKQVFEAFVELGDAMLKPIFDKLNGTVSYEDLKIIRFFRIS